MFKLLDYIILPIANFIAKGIIKILYYITGAFIFRKIKK